MVVSIVLPILFGLIAGSGGIKIAASVLALVTAVFFAKAKIEAYALAYFTIIIHAIAMFQMELYGEVIVQLLVVLPVITYGMVLWARSRLTGCKFIVARRTGYAELTLLFCSQIIMGFGYYFLLVAFDTAFPLLSTFTLATAVIANYLLLRRCHFGVGGYMLNNIALVALASTLISYGYADAVPMLVMALMFCVIDSYGTVAWKKLSKGQNQIIQAV